MRFPSTKTLQFIVSTCGTTLVALQFLSIMNIFVWHIQT